MLSGSVCYCCWFLLFFIFTYYRFGWWCLVLTGLAQKIGSMKLYIRASKRETEFECWTSDVNTRIFITLGSNVGKQRCFDSAQSHRPTSQNCHICQLGTSVSHAFHEYDFHSSELRLYRSLDLGTNRFWSLNAQHAYPTWHLLHQPICKQQTKRNQRNPSNSIRQTKIFFATLFARIANKNEWTNLRTTNNREYCDA